MPPIRTSRVLIEDSYVDGGGSIFQKYSRHCIAYHPYDIRDRGEVVLRMRAFRETELFAQQAGPKELPPPPTAKEIGRKKQEPAEIEKEAGVKEKTVFPAPAADEVRVLPVAMMGGRGCLEPLSQLDVLPEVPPLTLQYLMHNELQLAI